MRRIICIVIATLLVCGFAVFAADKTKVTSNTKKEYSKPEQVRAAKMNAVGKVLEISDNAVTIARSVRNTTQIMTFALDKQVKNISVGDFVSVAYVMKNNKLIAVRVTKSEKNISAKQPPVNTVR